MVSVSRSNQATAPSMIGEPVGAGLQVTPENLSPQREFRSSQLLEQTPVSTQES